MRYMKVHKGIVLSCMHSIPPYPSLSILPGTHWKPWTTEQPIVHKALPNCILQHFLVPSIAKEYAACPHWLVVGCRGLPTELWCFIRWVRSLEVLLILGVRTRVFWSRCAADGPAFYCVKQQRQDGGWMLLRAQTSCPSFHNMRRTADKLLYLVCP